MQARALASQLAETEKIRFFIGTQSLKQINNQIHLVEFDEENSTLKTTVFYHTLGEIWKLNSSPLNVSLITTCYNVITNDNTCSIKTSILKIPEESDPDQIGNLDVVVDFPSELLDGDVRTTEFHPTDENKCITVSDNNISLWDVSESNAKNILNVNLEGKNNPKFTTGKWNPHQNCNQVCAILGCSFIHELLIWQFTFS